MENNIGLRLKQLLVDLNNKEKNLLKNDELKPFIGYGNPEADILIVGKECAYDLNCDSDKKHYDNFYKPNFEQWEESFAGHGFVYTDGVEEGKEYSFKHNAFHPIYPFFWKYNNLKNSCLRHTNSTYYYYQMLIDKIRAEIERVPYQKSECITFFRDCFITEMNDICMRNHKDANSILENKVENSIKDRFDWMRKTYFFNQFKVVVLACGPYADAIKNDSRLKKELFGDALIVYCGQLSQWRKKELEGDLNNPQKWPNKIKEIANQKPRITSMEENKRFIELLLHP